MRDAATGGAGFGPEAAEAADSIQLGRGSIQRIGRPAVQPAGPLFIVYACACHWPRPKRAWTRGVSCACSATPSSTWISCSRWKPDEQSQLEILMRDGSKLLANPDASKLLRDQSI